MRPIIECNDLTAGYSGVPVVRGLHLEVCAGELVALLGPNGSGKTTTLLTLAGILAPIDGAAVYAGDRVDTGHPDRMARRGMCLVPDDRSIFHDLTARENLLLARRASGDPIKLALEYFPSLRSRLDVRAGLLSGGEQQMLAIGRAIARRPKALLVDELSLGLAPIVVRKLLPVLQWIARELETAVLMVEQHVDLALQAADRAYVLNHGNLVHQGTAADLLRQREFLEASYMGLRE